MAQEGFFTRVTNELLDASERLSTRLEEGLSVLLDGELPTKTKEQPSDSGPSPMGEDEDFIMEEDMLESPLHDIADGVLDDIMSSQAGPQTPMEHIDAFRSAITWSEPFILSLFTFQVITFLLCLWVSRPNRGTGLRIAFMIAVGVLVKSSEYLNSLGAQHWEQFATQNYFDNRGIFVGIMFCAPLLVDSFIMLVFFLREASQLLVQVKREEIKKQKKQKSNTTNNKKKKASKKDD